MNNFICKVANREELFKRIMENEKITPSAGDKIRLWFFRFFKQLLPFGWFDGKLEQPPVNGNEIEVTFDNVTANGCKLSRYNFWRYFQTSGNEDLFFS